MKPSTLLPLILLSVITPACKESAKRQATPAATRVAAAREDAPLLPISKGDSWRYAVHLEIPADATKPGTPAVEKDFVRTRTFLGKISPGKSLPATDCFEVTTAGFPAEREFVEIHNDKILLRGSVTLQSEDSQPMWYDPAVPFLSAGVKAGDELREFQVGGQPRTRKIQIVGREDVTVPAGQFPSIRMLMGGMDGTVELRRTIWFSPGTGIIREEKTRYHVDKLILRETQELTETSVKKR